MSEAPDEMADKMPTQDGEPASVLVQVLSRLARVFSRGAAGLAFAGKVVPGATPVAGFARLAAVTTAFAMPMALVAEAPMLPPGARNCESAQTLATVTTSLSTNFEPDVTWLQLPIVDRNVMDAFAAEAPESLPPWETR